jgi:hypothetical protein
LLTIKAKVGRIHDSNINTIIVFVLQRFLRQDKTGRPHSQHVDDDGSPLLPIFVRLWPTHRHHSRCTSVTWSENTRGKINVRRQTRLRNTREHPCQAKGGRQAHRLRHSLRRESNTRHCKQKPKTGSSGRLCVCSEEGNGLTT